MSKEIKSIDKSIIDEIINLWRQGVKLDEEGYEDLGFTLQHNALQDAANLDVDSRKQIADILFPIK